MNSAPRTASLAPKVEAAARPSSARSNLASGPSGPAPAHPSKIAGCAGGETLPGHLKRAWPEFDFRRVVIDASPQAAAEADALGAPAFAEGLRIAFAAGQYAPYSARGQHILAHEMAHVVQQERGLAASKVGRAALERDAERDASAATTGRTLRVPRRAGPALAVQQRFDPGYHEEATIGGLSGIFASEEIGKVYEGNWKRDFSQSWPEICRRRDRVARVESYDRAHHQTDAGLRRKFIWAVGKLLLIPNQAAIHNVTET
jgi:hypothetical protein